VSPPRVSVASAQSCHRFEAPPLAATVPSLRIINASNCLTGKAEQPIPFSLGHISAGSAPARPDPPNHRSTRQQHTGPSHKTFGVGDPCGPYRIFVVMNTTADDRQKQPCLGFRFHFAKKAKAIAIAFCGCICRPLHNRAIHVPTRWSADLRRSFKLSLDSEVMLAALALTAIVALGTTAYAASDDEPERLLPGQMSFFDPFSLTTVYVRQSSSSIVTLSGPKLLSATPVTKSSSSRLLFGSVKTRSAIRIPFRPALRSPFRPPLVPRRVRSSVNG
jgi:hypothetical protein